MPQDSLPSDALREALRSAFPPVPREAWHRKIKDDLADEDALQRLRWHTPDGFTLDPFYRADDLEALPASFLEAVRPRQTTGNAWHIRQDIAVHDLGKANRQAREALAQGATAIGFTTAENAPALLDQADLAPLLAGITLATTPLHWPDTDAPHALLDRLLDEAARQDVPPEQLQGSIAMDPGTRLIQTGDLDAEATFDEAARLLGEVEAVGAGLHTLRVDAQPFHEAGASAGQELAFALASASEIFARLTERGITVAPAARRLAVTVPVGTSHFMEIAKLRALRLLLAQLIQAYDAEAASVVPAIEAVTSRWTLTRYDPHSNLLRATTQAASALVGGCDTLTIRPFDSAAGSPSAKAFRLARTTQLLLKHEAHLDAVADPAAGSYYAETLTDALARQAWALFQQVEARGGLLRAFDDGFIQQTIQATRAQREHDIATGRHVFVGTNAYPDLDEVQGDAEGAPAASDQALLPRRRGPEAYEALRRRTERHAQRTGHRPTVFLLPIGPPAAANARATFARNMLGCAGFAIDAPPPFDTLQAGAEAALASRAEAVVLCSADADYGTYAPALSDHLDAGPKRPLLLVAGYPEGLTGALTMAGVDAFIHRNQNQLEALEQLQQRLEID